MWIEEGRIPANSTPENPITTKHLLDSRCVHNVKDGVKLLGDVSISQPFMFAYLALGFFERSAFLVY